MPSTLKMPKIPNKFKSYRPTTKITRERVAPELPRANTYTSVLKDPRIDRRNNPKVPPVSKAKEDSYTVTKRFRDSQNKRNK